MIHPVLQDDGLLADIKAHGSDDGFRLWWLGQSGFLLQWRGQHALLDPYLSDSLTHKYAGTETPHVRMTARAIDPARLDFVDVVSASHAHTDHMDADTLRPILQAGRVPLVIPEATRQLAAERLGVPPSSLIGLDDGRSVSVGPFRFSGIASAHEELESLYLGYVVQFGPWSVYHSGDTLLYEGLAEKLKPFSVDVALLPINGRAPERRVKGNLDAREAARLGRRIGARVVIPCHYEMFEFNTADPLEFAEAARAEGQPYQILRCGERWEGPGKQIAVLAGGCFWCMEAVFKLVEGVESVISGYSGGTKEAAKYDIVCTGRTGHAEAVLITYDPAKVSYGRLLEIFFTVAHDPTTLNRQGPDTGPQYRSAVFYVNEEQKRIAEAYIKQSKDAIVTQVVPLDKFYTAEAYHQNYAEQNPSNRYIVRVSDPKVEKLKKVFPGCVRRTK